MFGDGSVVIVSTPANTPGHESLFVNLPKTGPVFIGGDIYTDVVSHEMYLQYTHQEKKMTDEALSAFRSRFEIPIPDQAAKEGAPYRPSDDSPEIVYMSRGSAFRRVTCVTKYDKGCCCLTGQRRS